MRIGIDAHSLGGKQGGNETYYRSLLHSIARVDSENEYCVYYTGEAAPNTLELENGRFQMRRLRPASSYLRIPFVFPLELVIRPMDVFHAQFIVPPFVRCRTVTTIPDIAYEHHPEFFPPYQVVWSKKLIRWSARRADRIITVSNYSKDDISRTYDIDPEKISVTYEAAGREFYPRDRHQAMEYVARHYRINQPFILYVGRLQERKNLIRLLQAYSRSRSQGIQQPLVLVGGKDWMAQPIVDAISRLEIRDDVVLTGYVPSQDIPWFYSAADVFVYPSIFEGFGLPVLEAMSCGIPVITSMGSSLEEVAGDAAIIVDPLNSGSISSALERILGDSTLRQKLGQAGIRRSKKFDSDQTAMETVAAYRSVMGA